MADIYNQNAYLDQDFTYQAYSQPPPPAPVPIVTGDVNIVTTINGATGPITFSSPDGFAFSGAAGGIVTMTVSDPVTARAALGAAASGINTDISELNGASQVDVSSHYEVAGTQVVGAQQPAIPDPAGGVTVDVEGRAATALILAAMRAHGLLDT